MLKKWMCGGLWASLITALTIGCASPSAGVNYAKFAAVDPRARPYEIGVSDVVQVTVWRDPSLSTEMAVRPDGVLTVPLVGEVNAAGRTTMEVKKDIEQKLSAFVKNAVVTVAVIEVNSYRFTVAGNAERPGMFTPRYYVTVSEAIALAGGPNRYASASEVVVIRPRGAGAPERIPIDHEQILEGKRPDQNIVVLAGDTVLIP
jgi:polysaccharide export outer membrane protein